METGPRLKVSSDRLVKPGIEPATPCFKGKQFLQHTTAAPVKCEVCPVLYCFLATGSINSIVQFSLSYYIKITLKSHFCVKHYSGHIEEPLVGHTSTNIQTFLRQLIYIIDAVIAIYRQMDIWGRTPTIRRPYQSTLLVGPP